MGVSINILASNIYVQYRGNVNVDNGYFEQINLKESRFVKEMYYDTGNKYLIVRLKNKYYHYCSIPKSTVNKWTSSSSLGKFYNLNIKGNYDCRINPVPTY